MYIRAPHFKTLLVGPSKANFYSFIFIVIYYCQEMVTNTSDVLAPSSTSSPNKRSHKPTKIKTEDYHDQVVKKRRTQHKSKATKPSKNHQSQSIITSFLSPNKQTSLKEEDYFIVPSSVDGFNLLSLRRHFHSVKPKSNIIALIKKHVIHNNTIPSTQKVVSNTKRYSQRHTLPIAVIPQQKKYMHLDNRIVIDCHLLM